MDGKILMASVLSGVAGTPVVMSLLKGKIEVSLTDEVIVRGMTETHILTLKRGEGFKGELNLSLEEKPPKTDVSFSKEKVRLSKENPKEKIEVYVNTKPETPTGKYDLVIGVKGKDVSGIPKEVSKKARGTLKIVGRPPKPSPSPVRPSPAPIR